VIPFKYYGWWPEPVQWFQRRRFLKKFTYGLRQTTSDGNSSCGFLARWAKNFFPKIHFNETSQAIILRVSTLKKNSDVPVDQPTWLPLLKVEHMGKFN
jgi:hypothetical protein